MGKRETGEERISTYHGIPSFRVFCIAVRYANIPRRTEEAIIIITSQKLSWTSGQWYFRRRWTVMISVVAIVEGGSWEGFGRDEKDKPSGEQGARVGLGCSQMFEVLR